MKAMAFVTAINGSNNWSIDPILQYTKLMAKAFLKQLKFLLFPGGKILWLKTWLNAYSSCRGVDPSHVLV